MGDTEMTTEREASILIAASEARDKIDTSLPLKDQARAAMEITKDFWMSIDEDIRFRGAIAALILANEGNEDVVDRINTEMRMLDSLGAMLAGLPIDVERAVREVPDDFERAGFRELWMEIGHPQYVRKEAKT